MNIINYEGRGVAGKPWLEGGDYEESAAGETKTQEALPRPEMVTGEAILDLTESIYRSIADHAYEVYEARGREGGHDLEDWLQAELELMRSVPIEIHESSDQLIIRAEMQGFNAEETKVGIQPHRIIIWGKKEDSPEQKAEQAIRVEILQVLELPSEVDPPRRQPQWRAARSI